MFKTNPKDKMTLTGTIALTMGIGLLVFTFISAYIFLTQDLAILTSTNLEQTFGEALAPLISSCIRVMYLGVMGWIGSLLTIRGITIYSQTRQIPSVPTEMKTLEKTVEEEKEEVKTAPEVKKTEEPTSKSDETQPKQIEPKPEPKLETETETKPEPKPYEPEIIMLPPKTVEQVEEEPNLTKEQK
jgi:cytoskeletal protein RodZ